MEDGKHICACLSGALDFAGTEAAGTDPELDRAAVHIGPHWLQIGLPDFLGTDMRMADLHAYRSAFAANITPKRHNIHLLRTSHPRSILNTKGKGKRKIMVA